MYDYTGKFKRYFIIRERESFLYFVAVKDSIEVEFMPPL